MYNETGEGRIGKDSEGHRWRIYQTDDGRWRWKNCKFNSQTREDGEVIKKSDVSFDTEKECETDSRIHGMDGEYGMIYGRGTKLRD